MTVKDRIKELRETLNVKEYERFNIIGSNYNPHYFTQTELIDTEGNKEFEMLGRLVTEDFKIEKLPWTPKENGWYWIVDISSEGGVKIVENRRGKRSKRILKYYKIFRTKEDAIIERNKRVWWNETIS